MTVLVINTGSSSIKVALFDNQLAQRLLNLCMVEIGTPRATLRSANQQKPVNCDTHESAFQLIFNHLKASNHDCDDIAVVGHRVTHGGDLWVKPVLIDNAVITNIASLTKLAPLHNAMCLAGIRYATAQLPHRRHVAVFDTAFHASMPNRATYYALPQHLKSSLPIQRYGFHGISHQYVTTLARNYITRSSSQLRIVSCHLGSGCSVAAILNDRSIETSMGMTPLEGLVMGSRCGDLDAGIVIHLLREHRFTADQLDHLLNQESGLLGMAGTGYMADIESRAHNGDQACQLAIDIFVHRIHKYIGAYAAVLGGIDVIIFTGGIGENSALVRERVMCKFDYLGASIDLTLNEQAKPSTTNPVVDVSRDFSKVKTLVIATDEETEIARQIHKTD